MPSLTLSPEGPTAETSQLHFVKIFKRNFLLRRRRIEAVPCVHRRDLRQRWPHDRRDALQALRLPGRMVTSSDVQHRSLLRDSEYAGVEPRAGRHHHCTCHSSTALTYARTVMLAGMFMHSILARQASGAVSGRERQSECRKLQDGNRCMMQRWQQASSSPDAGGRRTQRRATARRRRATRQTLASAG